MDGVDRTVRKPTLKERLGFTGLGCFGATSDPEPTIMTVRDSDDEQEITEDPLSPQIEATSAVQSPIRPNPPCAFQSQGMNLAAALAAERQLRTAVDADSGDGLTVGPSITSPNSSPFTTVNERTEPGTPPAKVSLMRLLIEADGYDDEIKDDEDGCDTVCCVCMGRKKGAAFIPCGHTFCRACSRELWLNRGACPLCNRQIFEILDIY